MKTTSCVGSAKVGFPFESHPLTWGWELQPPWKIMVHDFFRYIHFHDHVQDVQVFLSERPIKMVKDKAVESSHPVDTVAEIPILLAEEIIKELCLNGVVGNLICWQGMEWSFLCLFNWKSMVPTFNWKIISKLEIVHVQVRLPQWVLGSKQCTWMDVWHNMDSLHFLQPVLLKAFGHAKFSHNEKHVKFGWMTKWLPV